ncbi:hypothetical protein Nepgr_030735 [Nepenthes gracilis]|uniref:Cornichon n=1 Tax=Nepenthes gracilis TaxID=150966 RepID=A0AAD3THJ5_NEPGR|nr:hypothetical protein Nepgr_030735 [Nepenthes gracilis]
MHLKTLNVVHKRPNTKSNVACGKPMGVEGGVRNSRGTAPNYRWLRDSFDTFLVVEKEGSVRQDASYDSTTPPLTGFLCCTSLSGKVSGEQAEEREEGKRKRGRMEVLFAWIVSFFILMALLVIVVYQLMCLADLEFDYINPYDSASQINRVIMPEFITQAVLCCFFLVTRHWFMSLLCAPYLYYNVKMYMDNQHLIDVTEIFNLLSWEKKKRLLKLAYLIIILFLSLFWLIWSTLEDDDELM